MDRVVKIGSDTRVVVLTGAGISAESGLKTFRDNNGLWENHRVEDVATPEAFSHDPNLVYRFYNARRAQLLKDSVRPNQAHLALSSLERYLGENLCLVTQNVDNLHEQAGSQRVLHMHGDLLSHRCTASGKVTYTEDAYDIDSRCDCCPIPQPLRPNIVWFGEMPLYMEAIYDALHQADVFISIGTSGNVYPAAGFVQEASQNGAFCVELNLEPSHGQSFFDHGVYGPATQVLPKFLQQSGVVN